MPDETICAECEHARVKGERIPPAWTAAGEPFIETWECHSAEPLRHRVNGVRYYPACCDKNDRPEPCKDFKAKETEDA